MTTEAGDGFITVLTRSAAGIEARLAFHLEGAASGGAPPRLVAAMRHAVLAGGKRFRPFLVIEMARVLGAAGAADAALDVAAALELVHAYSLVHDDLPAMDNDELRRGQPTVWKAYDEWTAILAGDALLTLAFEVVAKAKLPPEVAVAITRRLAAASGPLGMVGGQQLDLEADKRGEPRTPTVAHVRRLQAMKTGALITFAAEAGALVAEAPPAAVDAARRYGAALGLAFQISDDLLDVEGEAAVVGKAVGKDLALGKATLVAVLGIEQARLHLAAAVADAIGALAAFGPEADILRAAAGFQASRRS